MTTPQIDVPGTPPDPLAPQPTFRATFYAYLQQLVAAFGQANTVATWMGTTADAVATNATTASTAAGTATTKAGEAAASAAAALASEQAAAQSEIDAQAARDTAEQFLDAFQDTYLGPLAVDPLVDLDGNPLQVGALYYSTSEGFLKYYDGTAWLAAAVDVNGALIAVNNLADLADPATARLNLGLGSAALNDTGDFLQVVNNLSDLGDAALARDNLGLEFGATAPLADQLLAEAGTDNTTVMSPLRVAQAITALSDAGFSTVETITSSINWVVPPGVNRIKVIVIGGGGGGSGSGGGAGGSGFRYVDVIPGESHSIIIGFGGSNGANTASSGVSGGTTTAFGISAQGGQGGGTGLNQGGQGGVVSAPAESFVAQGQRGGGQTETTSALSILPLFGQGGVFQQVTPGKGAVIIEY